MWSGFADRGNMNHGQPSVEQHDEALGVNPELTVANPNHSIGDFHVIF